MINEIAFEDTPPAVPTNTISEAWMHIFRNPSLFIRYWNYKGAILSGSLRAPIFLVTYLLGKESLKLAIGAALAQFVFRFLFAGVGGALIQGFRRVEPPWKALLTILMIVPLISHLFEYLVQVAFAQATGTGSHTESAIIRSVCVSILSALFTLFIMRRNVMIVGEAESKSLFSDIAALPRMVFEFCAFWPNEIAAMLRRGAYLSALLTYLAFGVFSQLICSAVSNRAAWTYGGGKSIAYIRWFYVDGLIVMGICVIFSLIYAIRQSRRQNQS